MDLVDLENFLTLCKTRNFSRAAEHCHVTTSGLSRRIAGLEQWAGAPLFDRSGAVLALTPAGEALKIVAEQAVFSLRGVRENIRDSVKMDQRTVRIAAPQVVSTIFFPHCLELLHLGFPDLHIHLISDYVDECFRKLDEHLADFVFSLEDNAGSVRQRQSRTDPDRYDRLELGEESLIPVSAPDPAGRPLFGLPQPGQSSARPISFLNYDERCSLGWALRHALVNSPLASLLQEHHQHNLSNGVRDLALSRFGMAWLPRTMIATELQSGRLVPAADGKSGGSAHDIAMRITAYRRRQPMPVHAEQVWMHFAKNALPQPIASAT
jgi:DNA-binding transcriptional LysR family regulator